MSIIDKPTDYFNTVLYTGDGTSSNAITGTGFQPDFVWIKGRSTAYVHLLHDVVRGQSSGEYLYLKSDATSPEQVVGDGSGLLSLDTDGFTVGKVGNATWNNSGTTYASWSWKAGGTASSNTDGSITSSVSANQDAGFSIVTYTTPSSGIVTVGHGLGVKPAMLITKSRDNAYNWDVLHQSLNDDGVGRIILNDTLAFTSGNSYGSTTPTSSVFSFSADFYGASDNVTYCFAEKQGYSKFGSYTGNGSTNGTFVYTGFKPAFLIVKRTDAADGWIMFDNKRSSFNIVDKNVQANSNAAETTYGYLDFTSNGFKLRMNGASANGSGANYIYMCFAENPFVTSTGVPATAR